LELVLRRRDIILQFLLFPTPLLLLLLDRIIPQVSNIRITRKCYFVRLFIAKLVPKEPACRMVDISCSLCVLALLRFVQLLWSVILDT
jgi:hypothetical protein